jgi:hypothetical protein
VRKSWRKWLLLALAVAVLIVGWYALPPKSPSRKINPNSYERIKPGMRLAEVESLIGLPPGDYRDDAEKASGISPFQTRGIIDTTWMASEDWRATADWIAQDYAITVFLDGSGSIVEDKQLCAPLGPKRGGFWEQLLDWLK